MSYIDSEEKFFGREDILTLLKRRVVGLKDGYRQNIALLGNPYVGKSSVLQHFIANIDDDSVITIYLDLENKDFDYFYSKFIGCLLYNFSKCQNLPLYDDLNLLIESVSNEIPHTSQVIRKIKLNYAKGKLNNAYLGLLTLPEIFTNETGKFCILIFDEFQNLEEFSVNTPFIELGKKIMTQKKCFYIVTSSYEGDARKILSEKLSLLFGNFETINLDTFDPLTSEKFVEFCLKENRLGIQMRNILTDFTGGHPLYLYLISKELINLSAIHKQNEIYMPLLSQALENTIFDQWGVISRHFDLILNELCAGKGNRIYSSLLISLCSGKNKIDDLVSDLGIKRNVINQKLSRLLSLGHIIKNGNVYYLKDKLFKCWIKLVYQKRIKDVELAPDKQRREFKDSFNKYVENFKQCSRKDFSSRVVDLLSCFDNDSIFLKGRKYKLPQFREIIPFELGFDSSISFDVFQAVANDAEWYIVMKKDNVLENDVNFILQEFKKKNIRPERCLIVSLIGIEENARLKALQERYWIWNEEELNILLTLFDKPYILR